MFRVHRLLHLVGVLAEERVTGGAPVRVTGGVPVRVTGGAYVRVICVARGRLATGGVRLVRHLSA